MGWRGMVGSVLVERMLAEKDFEQDFEPTFFTTSNVGGKGPEVGKDSPPLVDAYRYHEPPIPIPCRRSCLSACVANLFR